MKNNKEETLTGLGANGIWYIIDPETKKCRKLYKDVKSVIPDYIDDDENLPLTVYEKYKIGRASCRERV